MKEATSLIGCLCFSSDMAFSSCFYPSLTPIRIAYSEKAIKSRQIVAKEQKLSNSFRSSSTQLFSHRITGAGAELHTSWDFLGGSVTIIRAKFPRLAAYKRSSRIYASWFTSAQIATSAFTLGTVAVLPFYALMVVAPKSELTKKSMESGVPFLVLGLLYIYLLCLSWTPETMRLMFASPYWLPELPGIARMFNSELTLASAWIHLLVVDLFAARQIFHDGRRNEIETRHSVTLCLFFCPLGIITHFITKALTGSPSSTRHEA